jgi:nitrate reductase gamma subunit
MVWLGIAIVIAALLLTVGRVRATRRTSPTHTSDDLDPWVVAGTAITGAGAILVTTLGPVMYVVMAAGLIAVAVGIHRTPRLRRR